MIDKLSRGQIYKKEWKVPRNLQVFLRKKIPKASYFYPKLYHLYSEKHLIFDSKKKLLYSEKHEKKKRTKTKEEYLFSKF